MIKKILAAMSVLLVAAAAAQNTAPDARPRASDLGLKVGILPTGPLDAITDVAGVEVGQTTIIRGGDLRTGVTAILPHPGSLFREKVPGSTTSRWLSIPGNQLPLRELDEIGSPGGAISENACCVAVVSLRRYGKSQPTISLPLTAR